MKDHVYANYRFLYEQKGYLLENGIFSRYEPIGVKWNDSFCRRIVNEGQPGCFVERDIDSHQINYDYDYLYDYQLENNCTGRSLRTSLNKL